MLKKQNAFTLIELMVTLVVLGVVLTVALPSFKSQILNNKAAGLSEDFLTALNYVRSEAVKQGKPSQGGTARFITLCASANGTACSADTSGWQKGFIAVVDYAPTEASLSPVLTDATHSVATVLRVWPPQDPKTVITVKHTSTTGPTAFIRYTNLGKLAARLSPPSPITITTKMTDKTATDCLLNSARQIDINTSGMTSLSKIDCWAN